MPKGWSAEGEPGHAKQWFNLGTAAEKKKPFRVIWSGVRELQPHQKQDEQASLLDSDE
jgi:hypothetical protein